MAIISGRNATINPGPFVFPDSSWPDESVHPLDMGKVPDSDAADLDDRKAYKSLAVARLTLALRRGDLLPD